MKKGFLYHASFYRWSESKTAIRGVYSFDVERLALYCEQKIKSGEIDTFSILPVQRSFVVSYVFNDAPYDPDLREQQGYCKEHVINTFELDKEFTIDAVYSTDDDLGDIGVII